MGTILLFFINFTNLFYFFIKQEFSVEVSFCAGKFSKINYYTIKCLLVILMKHSEGLENEKTESTLTHCYQK